MVKSLIENSNLRKSTYKRRMIGIKKKAMELATLCGITVCIISFGPDGELETWPENSSDVRSAVDRYRDRCKLEIEAEADEVSLIDEKMATLERIEREIVDTKKENSRKILRLMQTMADDLTSRVDLLKTAFEQSNADGNGIVFDEMINSVYGTHPRFSTTPHILEVYRVLFELIFRSVKFRRIANRSLQSESVLVRNNNFSESASFRTSRDSI
ncbi:agamous-like MADS-box protein AGL53 [Actinidia eriantha]|uniref:agamous-like MADS-box protein AGL53 n=1 Tax=Actinidia eriantha TaxID=165200 RepID=UPI0025885579|nr:agamous-like MADS-box protein AGL53 [Actinidia eriantha]